MLALLTNTMKIKQICELSVLLLQPMRMRKNILFQIILIQSDFKNPFCCHLMACINYLFCIVCFSVSFYIFLLSLLYVSRRFVFYISLLLVAPSYSAFWLYFCIGLTRHNFLRVSVFFFVFTFFKLLRIPTVESTRPFNKESGERGPAPRISRSSVS